MSVRIIRLVAAVSVTCSFIVAGTPIAGAQPTPPPLPSPTPTATEEIAPTATPTSTPSTPQQTFSNPPELVPNGDGVYELRFGPVEHVIDGERYCLRGYNGTIPGPTMRFAPGTDRRVRIDLHNDFTQSDYREVAGREGQGHVSCHDFNLTNLHAHGSHIRPDFSQFDPGDPCTGDGCGPDQRYHADNVLHHVAFGEFAQFRWDLDEDHVHYPGLNWYHPHIHGSTAIQVSNGATGAWIVEGDVDAVPEIANAEERVIVLNHVPYTSDFVTPLSIGESCAEDTLSVNNFLAVTQASPTLVNGMVRPRIVTPPNQVERWRIVHAGSPDEMQMALLEGADDDCTTLNPTAITPLSQIAADGIVFGQLYDRDWTFVSSGYRVEALVKMPPVEKTLCLLAVRSRDIPGDPGPGNVILIVNVSNSAGAPTSVTMPDAADLAALAPPTQWTGVVDGASTQADCSSISTVHQKAVLLLPAFAPEPTPSTVSDGGSCVPEPGDHSAQPLSMCDCPEPNINCRNFDNRRVWDYRSDRVMTAGETEKWSLQATDGHPFHIHINPFVVCPRSTTREPPFAHWRDTYFVQADEPPVEMLTEYREFSGRYVLHCHKLNHEDEGMMELVEVCEPGDDDCLCLDGGTAPACKSNAGCLEDDLQCLFAQDATERFPLPAVCNHPDVPTGRRVPWILAGALTVIMLTAGTAFVRLRAPA